MKTQTLKELREEVEHYFNNFPFAGKRIFVMDESENVLEIPKAELIVEVQELIEEAFEMDNDSSYLKK